MFDKESKSVHVGDVNLLPMTRDDEDAFCEVLSIETSINPPFPFLCIASNGSSSEKNARPITAIQVESGEAEFKGHSSISTQTNVSLSSPLRNAQRNGQDGVGKPLWLI
ncbi:MAG: hypothetical protein OXF97_05110 [Nitrospira sp.]|nr:hypothetical protein [Nitrospira sp.]